MNEKDILLGLSYIDKKYIEEAETAAYPVRRFRRRPLLIAAVIALMLFLMGCAIAALSLRHLTVDVPTYTNFSGEERTVISMQGFQGTPSYEAFREWQTFLESYDPDKSILYASDDFERPDAYDSYFCYSQEMVDKIDEICEKYDLEPLGKSWDFRQPEHLFEALGIDSIFTEKAVTQGHTISGYCFQDGTFDMEGDFHLTGQWDQDVGFTIRSVQKTAFDGVFGNVGDLDSYDQWEYTMADGTTVLLALYKADGQKAQEGRIIVDKEDCFVMVGATGALHDPYGGIPNERSFLEDFCEAFDFTYQTQRVDPDKAYALQCEEEPRTYTELIQYMLEEESEEYPSLEYALVDINGDGQEELLLRCEDSPLLTHREIQENMFFCVKSMRDGELVHLTGDGYLFLCQGNVIESLSPFEGEENRHDYERYDQKLYPEWREQIIPADGTLYHVVGGEQAEITEEEAREIMAKYPRMEIEFKPASEFTENKS